MGKKPTKTAFIANIVGLLLSVGAITVLVYFSGTDGFAVHFYYIPIMYAGFIFGDYGAIIISLLCAALCGPWMPAQISIEGPVNQELFSIILRSLMFYTIGIASSRLSLELKRRVVEAKTLYDVARSVTSTLRIREVLDRIAHHATEVMGAKACAIRLLDKDNSTLEMTAHYGLSDEYIHKGPVVRDDSEVNLQALSGEVVQVADVLNDPRSRYRDEAAREGIAASISVPLVSKDTTRGIIRIYSNRPRKFRPREIDLLQAFARQAALAIENAELYEDIRGNFFETVRALAIAIEAKDSAVYSHSERTTEVALKIAEAMGYSKDDLEMLRFGTILHDIGKIGVAESAMESREGEDEDAVFYRMHPLIGRSILQPISFLEPVLPVIVAHHEAWDGSGFPLGLKGEDIPQMARIMAVADRYERLMNPPMATMQFPLSEDEARAQIIRGAGRRFDPEVVAAFEQVFGGLTDETADCW